PPLRQRVDDIPSIVAGFIEEFNAKYDKHVKAAGEATLEILMSHSWPGNVRELRDVVERALITCEGDILTLATPPSDSKIPAQPRYDARESMTVPLGLPLREVEKEFVLRTLAAENNNKTRAAERLQIAAKTLHNMLHRWELMGTKAGLRNGGARAAE